MRFFILLLGAVMLIGCGSGDGGTGGAGGGGLVGDAECVAAQEYINGEPCASDPNLDNSAWQIPLTGCMDENETKLCVNCLRYSSSDECLLQGSCATECYPLRN